VRKILFLFIFFLTWICCAYALSGNRLTDKEVKELIENVEKGRDRFVDAMDDKTKHSIYRGPRGEVNISEYLDDFKENIKNLKERFTKEYAASSEAAKVLDQASDIDRFVKSHPGGKAESEWERFTVDLRQLAAAYNASFPLPENAPVRRINDAEAVKTIEMVAKQGDQLKKEIGKDKSLTKEQKEGYKRDVEEFTKQAKTLKSRISDGKPATAEMRALLDTADRIGQSLQGTQMSPAVNSAWSSIQSSLDKLEAAFGMSAPPA
jgi:hypothetical protein